MKKKKWDGFAAGGGERADRGPKVNPYLPAEDDPLASKPSRKSRKSVGVEWLGLDDCVSVFIFFPQSFHGF